MKLSRTLSAEAARKREVLGLAVEQRVNVGPESEMARQRGHLHSHTLSVDRRKVGVLEEGDKVGLSGLLQGHDGGGLETEIRLETRCQHLADDMMFGGGGSP